MWFDNNVHFLISAYKTDVQIDFSVSLNSLKFKIIKRTMRGTID